MRIAAQFDVILAPAELTGCDSARRAVPYILDLANQQTRHCLTSDCLISVDRATAHVGVTRAAVQISALAVDHLAGLV